MATKTKARANGTAEENKLHPWQEEFTIKADLREKDVVALEKAAAAIPHIMMASTNSYNGAYLCAAIEAGWIEVPETRFEEVKRKGEKSGRVVTEKRYYYGDKEVGDIHPGAVRWLGQQVIGRYNEVTAVPLAL